MPEPIRPLHERSQIYLEMLSLLRLEPKHYENLRRRGLSDEIIHGNMYRSIPTDWKQRRRVVEQLVSSHDLSGVPGFYTRNLRLDMSNCRYSGILIPVCDMNNQIQGLYIRLDEPPTKIITKPDGTKVEKKVTAFDVFLPAAFPTAKSS